VTDRSERQLVVGVLGMPDNVNTVRLLEKFDRAPDVSVDFVIYWRPNLRQQCKRVLRKLKTSGVRATLQRIVYALGWSRASRADKTGERPPRKPIREYCVADHNSRECREIVKQEKADLLLLSTDAIIRSAVLKAPRLGVLNAHPGWVPQFRGLACLCPQLEAGFKPAISLHLADEGVDTGPLILRREFEFDWTLGLDHVVEEMVRCRHELLLEGVRLYRAGKVELIDTFLEPSNMIRRMPLRRVRALDRRMRSGKFTPSRSLQQWAESFAG
jgi:folate-dependent phosphoribosylglycinamide formyltransferase PurN